MRLLMVCLGNICRSPLAEGALRTHLDRHGLDWVQVDSAGTGDWHAGQAPDRRSIAVAAGAGVDIARQRARQLVRGDFDHFDWLLCADRSVLRDVRALAPPDARARAALLLDWAGAGSGDIPDPYTGGATDFAHVWTLVDTAAAAVAARLATPRTGPGAG